jgi:hypothetical protein
MYVCLLFMNGLIQVTPKAIHTYVHHDRKPVCIAGVKNWMLTARGLMVGIQRQPTKQEILYALHVTVLWDRVVINRQTVRIPVACLEIVGGVTLMRTYVLASNTNANYLACARFSICAFLRLRVLAFVRAFVCSGPGD